MSAPETLSIGVSSFSFNQDVIKLRQCLGSTEIESSGEGSDTYGTSDQNGHLPFRPDEGPEEYHPCSNEISQSQDTAVYSLDISSVKTAASSHSRQETYLRDHNLEAVLVTNQMYQEYLMEAIIRLDMALVKNLERQSAVQYELDHGRVEKDTSGNRQSKLKTKHWQVLCAPYLKDQDGFPFPENAHAKYKHLRNETSPYLCEPPKWTKHEQALLFSAVKLDLKKRLAEPILQRKEIICSKLKEKDLAPELIDDLKFKLNKINSELEVKMNLSDTEIMSQCSLGIDWMKISTVEFEGLRSAECCEIMWNNSLQPNIYKATWTKEEDTKLVEVVRRHCAHNWNAIAQELGSKRTAEQCIKRYNGFLNPDMVQKGSWNDEENQTLRELVDELRVGESIPWGKVSSYLESRHPCAVRKHWIRTLNNEIKRGSWSLEEDIILLLGFKKYGMDFNSICNLLPGRTYMQCRERYISSLDSKISFEKWACEEDRKLVHLAKEKGMKWAEVAESLPGRTPGMVRQRYAVVLKNIPDASYRVEDLNDTQWPYTSSYNNHKATDRRRKAYEYITSRCKVLKDLSPGQLPEMRQSVKRSRNTPQPHSSLSFEDLMREFSSDSLNKKCVDFMLDETISILNHKVKLVQQHEKHQERQLKKKAAVDFALDSLLLPSIVCKTPGMKKGLAFTGKEALEFEWCQTFLLTALKFTQDRIPGGSSVCDNTRSEQLIGETSGGSNLKKNKHQIRNDFFTHGIHQTIQKQCLGDISKHESCSILPPMRPSVNAFKLMVMDRKRVIDLAPLVEDVAVIQKITETPPDKKPLCAAHINSQTGSDSSPHMNSQIRNYSTTSVNNQSRNDCIQFIEQIKNCSNISSGGPETIRTGKTTTVIHGNCTQPEGNGCENNQSENCRECSHLAELHSSYYKFKNRFISLFFWPAQMYLIPPPEVSIDPSPQNFLERTVGRKRKVKKEIITNNDDCQVDLSSKKLRKPREFKYKNLSPVRSSARQANKMLT